MTVSELKIIGRASFMTDLETGIYSNNSIFSSFCINLTSLLLFIVLMLIIHHLSIIIFMIFLSMVSFRIL